MDFNQQSRKKTNLGRHRNRKKKKTKDRVKKRGNRTDCQFRGTKQRHITERWKTTIAGGGPVETSKVGVPKEDDSSTTTKKKKLRRKG